VEASVTRDADPDADLALILAAFDRTRRHHVKESAIFAAAAVLVVVVGILSGSWWLTVVGGGFFGGIAVLILRTRTAVNDPRRSTVLAALLERPEEITRVHHHLIRTNPGWFDTHWIHLTTREGEVAQIRVDEPGLSAMGQVLARHCPNAEVDVPGFARQEPDTSPTGED